MEQNNFEKNIQRKLDGLKINPSESVWQNVEKQIEKKDSRRWKAFIIFFLFLFIFTGGYWLLNFDKNNYQQRQKNSNQDIVISTIKKDSSANQSLLSEKADTEKVIFKDAKTTVDSIVSVDKNVNPYKRKNTKTGFLKKGNFKAAIKNVTASENENLDEQSAEKDQKLQNDFSHEMNSATYEERELVADFKKSEEMKVGHDSAIQPTTIEKKLQKADSDLTVNSKKAVDANHKKKWNLGVTISGGKSLIGNEFLGIDNNNNSDYMSSPNTGSGSGPGVPSFYPPSAIKNSFAFITGVFAEKNISVNHKISFGINYKYFSTQNKVGNKIDSIQTAYNFSTAASGVNNHRNNFNYLEFPVSLKLRLGKGNSFPLYWQAGINISQLISSSALQFKSSPGIYYNDNSLFNKTQFGFNTAILATVFSKQKTPVTIGPYFYYSASRLADKGLYAEKHFSFIGIRTEILFQKK